MKSKHPTRAGPEELPGDRVMRIVAARHFQARRFDEAGSAYARLSNSAGDPAVLHHLAVIEQERGRNEKALELIEGLLPCSRMMRRCSPWPHRS
ncbi:MAG: hypothetical protein ACFCUR_18045 [Rhodomicrobiaceae bacterium]